MISLFLSLPMVSKHSFEKMNSQKMNFLCSDTETNNNGGFRFLVSSLPIGVCLCVAFIG